MRLLLLSYVILRAHRIEFLLGSKPAKRAVNRVANPERPRVGRCFQKKVMNHDAKLIASTLREH